MLIEIKARFMLGCMIKYHSKSEDRRALCQLRSSATHNFIKNEKESEKKKKDISMKQIERKKERQTGADKKQQLRNFWVNNLSRELTPFA